MVFFALVSINIALVLFFYIFMFKIMISLRIERELCPNLAGWSGVRGQNNRGLTLLTRQHLVVSVTDLSHSSWVPIGTLWALGYRSLKDFTLLQSGSAWMLGASWSFIPVASFKTVSGRWFSSIELPQIVPTWPYLRSHIHLQVMGGQWGERPSSNFWF